MTMMRTNGTTLSRRRQAYGLLLACSALILPSAAFSQSLFPDSGSALPAIPSSQVGTAGTSTITRNTPIATANDTRPGTVPVAGTEPAGDTTARLGTAARVQEPEVDLNQPIGPSDLEPVDDGPDAIDPQEAPGQQVDPTGIRLGTFMLRPSINQSINTESTRENGTKETRHYAATSIRGTLTSDWSRHALTVTGETTIERNFTKSEEGEDPEGNINADLRLDLADDTVAHLTGGYNFTREDSDDPNAVGGADVQSGVHLFQTGASIARNIGKIRALAAVNGTRYVYTEAKLADGSTLITKDRNRSGIDGRLRLGYELSPALIPFAEIASGHTFYDRKRDASGYQRSSQTYAARTGVEFDFGEKLRGELGTGYEVVDYEDNRLKNVGGITFDGDATWSPQRGTDVSLGLRTTVQDSTTPGEGGWVQYELTAALAHEMRDSVVARLSGGTVFRNFDAGREDEVTWLAGAGITWAINRYLDLTSDLEYEKTTGGTEQNIVRAGMGLTLKR
jgi:hypothetical protein